jgi:hypothetical protein
MPAPERQAVALRGLLFLIGVFVMHVLISGRAHSMDVGVDVWFAARRTGVWNSITMSGVGLAETQTAGAVRVVVVLFLRWRLDGGMRPPRRRLGRGGGKTVVLLRSRRRR